MKRFLVLPTLFSLLVTCAAWAAAPSTISYQGVLMDNTGAIAADGLYNFTFRIYDVGSGGAPLWTETTNNVTVTKGGFSVLLGNLTPIALPFDRSYYLGIVVNGQPELVPRVVLGASPYALGLRIPFSVTDASTGPLVRIHNVGGGPDLVASRALQVGGVDSSGSVQVFGPPGGGAISVQGDGGAGSPRLTIQGTAGTIVLDGGALGDSAVVLPVDAISAAEIRDEAGIAQGRVPGINNVTSTATMADVATVTLTTPADGYVVVTATSQAGFSGTTGANYVTAQIDDVAGGTENIAYSVFVGANAYAGTSIDYRPFISTRVFQKPAGTYTFRLEATKSGAGTAYFWNPTVTAEFVPTSYGTVTTIAPLAEARALGLDGRTVTVTGQDGSASPVVVGDLRALEQRIAREKTRLAEDERRLARTRGAAR
jgi:hypothetical protein